jgi:hypothetical protein
VQWHPEPKRQCLLGVGAASNFEEHAITTLPLPLNIEQNEHYCFCPNLRKDTFLSREKARLTLG